MISPVFDLLAYSGQVVQFGILGSEGTVDDPEDNDIFVDNFRVRPIPTCAEPNGLSVANFTVSSADISWTGNNGETSWEYVVVPAGIGEPTGSGMQTSTPSASITGLEFSTDYEI